MVWWVQPVRSHALSLAFAFAFAMALSALWVQPVAARREGIAAQGCNGCHQNGQEPGLRVLASPANPEPGQRVAITVEIDAVNGSVGGFYLLLEDGGGALSAAANSGVRQFSPAQLGHSTPKAASGGVVRFNAEWTAPASAGGAVFRAWAVSANGDDRSGGDGAAEGELLIAVGCAGELYAIDPDGDGYGAAELGRKRDCSLPAGYSRRDGDCAEYDPAVHPDAAERCNEKDDDCDGRADEALPIGPQYPDADGDGHGDITSSTSIEACSSPKGYAAQRDDCNDEVASVHPGAEESCDYMDEDCDGRSDENARAACGVGWCRRLADSCNVELCTPGKPRAEMCNAFDDDCDDRADEDASCPAGQRCMAGRCAEPGASGGSGSGAAAGAAAQSGGGAGGAAGVANAGAAAVGGGGRGGDPGAGGAGAREDCAATSAAGAEACPAERDRASGERGCSVARIAPRAPARGLVLGVVCALAFATAGALRRRRQPLASP